MKFLWRKIQRWQCGVFVYSQSFQLLSTRSSIEESRHNQGSSFADIMIFERSRSKTDSLVAPLMPPPPGDHVFENGLGIEEGSDGPTRPQPPDTGQRQFRIDRALMHVRSTSLLRLPSMDVKRLHPEYRITTQEGPASTPRSV